MKYFCNEKDKFSTMSFSHDQLIISIIYIF